VHEDIDFILENVGVRIVIDNLRAIRGSSSGVTVKLDSDCDKSFSSDGVALALAEAPLIEEAELFDTLACALIPLVTSLALGRRTRLGSFRSMNFSSIFKIASRAMYAFRRR
jgi:hypothetical protein